MTNGRGDRHYTAVLPNNIYCIDGLTYSDRRIKTRKFISIPSSYNELQKGLRVPRSGFAACYEF